MKPQVASKYGKKRKLPFKTKMKKGTNKLSAMSVDDFMENGLDDSDASEHESTTAEVSNGKSSKSHSAFDKEVEDSMEGNKDSEGSLSEDGFVTDGDSEESDKESNENEDADSDGGGGGGDDKNDNDSREDDGDWTSANFSHKKAIEKLKETDPEFYSYLQENDKELLNFDESDGEGEDERGGEIHAPPEKLEVASDESDADVEGRKEDPRTVTLKMVKDWETKLRTTSMKSCETIIDVMHAFHAAVIKISNEDDDSAKYVVTRGAVFNAVVQLCVLDLQPGLKKYLKLPSGHHVDPTKNKIQWNKVKKDVKSYLTNLIKILSAVTSSQVLAVMLKHLHQMMPFAACFIVLRRPLLKKLVTLWSTSEDTVRIVAFLCLLKLSTHQPNILDKLLKMMYLAFVRNCKFVSPSTLPGINFMRRSLVEMFALDLNISYGHVFLYIRQLAIHLRNAITLQKKEHVQAVYNWQFVNSIHLWADLLGATANKPQLNSLIYPLVQVTLGTIKLVPAAQYFPLRFHCTQILIELSKRTCTFIPVLPFLLEVLNNFNFNKPHKKVSMKPTMFSFIIRVSNLQMQENGFKDAIVDTIYQQIMEYLSSESSSISFPDLVIPTIMQIKQFLKKCKAGNHCRKMKQLLDKIVETSEMVEKERQKVNFKLSDSKSIAAWETQLKLKGTPLSKFYENWSKINAQQQAKLITQNDKIGDFNLPVLKKRVKEERTKSEGPVVLFPSDDSDSDINFKGGDEDESDDDTHPKEEQKRSSVSGRRNKKSKKVARNVELKESLDGENMDDIVEDLKLEDFS